MEENEGDCPVFVDREGNIVEVGNQDSQLSHGAVPYYLLLPFPSSLSTVLHHLQGHQYPCRQLSTQYQTHALSTTSSSEEQHQFNPTQGYANHQCHQTSRTLPTGWPHEDYILINILINRVSPYLLLPLNHSSIPAERILPDFRLSALALYLLPFAGDVLRLWLQERQWPYVPAGLWTDPQERMEPGECSLTAAGTCGVLRLS